MKVETSSTIYDDADKRCTLYIKSSAATTGKSYLVMISGYDCNTGAINWYFGTTELHFSDYDEAKQRQIITHILRQGGDCWELRERLNRTYDYLEGLGAE